MMLAGSAALFLLAISGSAEGSELQDGRSGSVTVRHQMIVRVPQGIRRIAPAGTSMIRWREGRGPHCVSAAQVIGASLLGQNSVDLILRDNRRIRARLARRCPALDYYRGFYINATEDGRICADRDTIRSRAGGECVIDRFLSLHAIRR